MFNQFRKTISKLLLLTFIVSLLPTYSVVFAQEKVALVPTNNNDLPFYVDSFNQEQPTDTTQIDTSSENSALTNNQSRDRQPRPSKTRPEKTIFTRIQDAENVTKEFKIWTEEINDLDEKLFILGNEEIIKADTTIETQPLIDENKIILEIVTEKQVELTRGMRSTSKNNAQI